MIWQVAIAQGPELFRRQLNAILAEIQAAVPSSGASLPVSATPDDALFVLTTTNQIYQARGGTWHAIVGTWGP